MAAARGGRERRHVVGRPGEKKSNDGADARAWDRDEGIGRGGWDEPAGHFG